MSKRIPDFLTASRCIDAICDYLQRHESPLTAADLREAINLIVQSRERKAFEAGRKRDPGYHSWNPDSGYSSCDAEMRGTTYHEGTVRYSGYDDYKQSEEYLK